MRTKAWYAETTPAMKTNLLKVKNKTIIGLQLTGLTSYVYALVDGKRSEKEIIRDVKRWWFSLHKVRPLSSQVREAIGELVDLGVITAPTA